MYRTGSRAMMASPGEAELKKCEILWFLRGKGTDGEAVPDLTDVRWETRGGSCVIIPFCIV